MLSCFTVWGDSIGLEHVQSDLKTIKKFVDRYCFDCHDEDIQKGGLNIADSKLQGLTLNDESIWYRVFKEVKDGNMPPKKKKRQPDEVERINFLTSLDKHLSKEISTRHEADGRTVIRRMTAEEYENTLRDLLQIDDLRIRHFLPADRAPFGFDNVGHAQNLSHVQISSYMNAADYALGLAVRPEPEPVKVNETKSASEFKVFQLPIAGRLIDGKAHLVRQSNQGQKPFIFKEFTAHARGKYRLKVWAQGARHKGIKSGGKKVKGNVQQEKYELFPTEKQHVFLFAASPLKKVVRKLKNGDIPYGDTPQAVQIEAGFEAGESFFFKIDTLGSKPTGDCVIIEKMALEGPIFETWPPASHKVLFGDLQSIQWSPDVNCKQPANSDSLYRTTQLVKNINDNNWMVTSQQPQVDARRLLQKFIDKAYRRPVASEELEPFLSIFNKKLNENFSFQESLKAAYKAVLCSPSFLYLEENPGELNSYALASRLSYFLWKSMPDEKLIDLAESGKLSNSDILSEQIKRMLLDPKSNRFIQSFTNQWLGLKDIEFTLPDKTLYPEFDEWLLDSMVRESHRFFKEMVSENLSASHLVDSDFIFSNQRLSKLYDLPPIKGDHLRKVALPKDSVRGGILTQASILKITANGTTTSPVIRGAWIAEELMGVHIPPPPENAGSVEPDTRGTNTVRELLDKHSNNASCINCHKSIDPPGFALESFDVMGAYREKYRSTDIGESVNKKIKGIAVDYKLALQVDSSGSTKTGETFSDVNGFREILLKDKRNLAKNLLKKLLTFATGSKIKFTDEPTIESILSATEGTGYGTKDLIEQIVLSKIFRSK